MLTIATITPGGGGEELELCAGDRVIAINGFKIKDLVDWHFYIAAEELELEIKTSQGERFIIEVEKDYDDNLGLGFACDPRSCANKCVFCFIDQQPPGLRDTLYVKDDDYRLSFLQGNYVTLTNITKKEKQRIIDERLSPLYVSIHATEPQVRARLLGRTKGGEIMEDLRRFQSHGLEIHGQIVLVPGYNDGPSLTKTLEELLTLGHNLLSLAVVPVGLSRHREGLAALKPVDKQTALAVIEQINYFRHRFIAQTGRATAYAADEFYLLAELPVPETDYYEDFAQLENGIGLIRKTIMDMEVLAEKKPIPSPPASVLILTGMAARGTIVKVSAQLSRLFPNLTFSVKAVENHFLGKGITVAGLLCGGDILRQLELAEKSDLLVLPGVAVRAGKFIDGVILEEIEEGFTAATAPETILELFDYLKEWVM